MARTLSFSGAAWNDFESWMEDRKAMRRINSLLKEILRSPTEGMGKPKQLSGDLRGCWSRRIDDKHRIVYVFNDEVVEIVRCRSHYGNT